MRRVTVILAVLALAGGLGAWWLWPTKPSGMVFVQPEPAAMLRQLSLTEALELNRATVRLQPDRRFVAAFRDVSEVVSTRAARDAGVQWRGTAWELRADGSAPRLIPLLASFAQQLSVLIEHAGAALTEPALPAVSLEKRGEAGPSPSPVEFHGMAQLAHASDAWRAGRRDARVALTAARALGWMLLQSSDPLELADPIASRALAALAIARVLDPTKGAEEECLVSYALGYSAHAQAVAKALGEDDPLRAFVLADDDRLERLARSRGDFETHFLRLLRLAQERNDAWGRAASAAWIDRAGRDHRALAFASAFAGPTHERAQGGMPALMLLTSGWTRSAIPKQGAMLWAASRSADVEAAIERAAAEREAGPFLDASLFARAHAALYFGALDAALVHVLYASIDEARGLLERLPRTEPSRLRELREWYQIRVDWQAGADVSAGRALAVDRERFFGAPLRARLLGSLDWTPLPGTDDRDARTRAVTFLATLDARPAHREMAAELARGRLRDPLRADAFESSLVRDDGPRRAETRVQLLLRHGGAEALVRELALPSTPDTVRHEVYRQVAESRNIDPDHAASILGKLWVSTKHDPWLYRPYRGLVSERLEDWKTAEALARTRLAQLPDDAPVVGEIRADLVRALRLQGRLREALDIAKCCLSQHGSGTQYQAIVALVSMERLDEAVALGEAARKQIGPAQFLDIALAEADWRRGRAEAAARRITPPAHTLDDEDFRDSVAYRMFSAFGQKPAEEALDAFDWLVRLDAPQGQRNRVESIAAHFQARGRTDVAFAMYERLARFNFALWKNTGAEPLYEPMAAALANDKSRSRCLALAWRALAQWQGRAAADAWIVELRERPFPWQLAPNLFAGGAAELLWLGWPEPQPPSYVALMRAHAIALDPALAEQHGAAVRAALEHGPPRGDRFFARIALGMDSEASLLETRMDARTLCQAAFYLGLAAQGRGELARAAEWYQVVLDSELITFNVRAYARDQLDAWRDADQGFEIAPRWDEPVISELAARL